MNFFKIPTHIQYNLYEQDFLDCKLISILLNKSNATFINSKSLIIKNIDLKQLLEDNFYSYIELYKSQTTEEQIQTMNSIVFLYTVVETFSNLKFISINVLNDLSFNRVTIDENGIEVPFYNYNILNATINLPEFFNLDELKILNSIFYKCNILDYNNTFINIKSKSFYETVLEYFEDETYFNEQQLSKFDSIFLQKLDDNDTQLLIITDF